MCKKSIFWMLAGGLLALTIASFSSHAASVRDSDYVAIGVPDLPQATAFFRNILDCEPVNPVAGNELPVSAQAGHSTPVAPSASRLLLCNVAHADRWLRREGVKVIGAPVALTSGPHTGQTVVNFVAPWGLRLQLVGRTPSQVATAP
ncbi:MAG: VOC family protein [Rhodanobacter sp.]